MRVTVVGTGGPEVVEVVRHGEATVGDLLAALDHDGPGIAVDGGPFVARTAALPTLVRGSRIDLVATRRRPAGPRDTQLVVASGVDTGRRTALGRRRVLVGRDPSCDLVVDAADVSPHHCVVHTVGRDLVAVDLASATGTRRDTTGAVEVGSVRLRATTAVSGAPVGPDEVDDAGLVPLRSGPRRRPAAPPTIPVPAEPTDTSTAVRRAAWAGVVASVVVGLVLAVVISPTMAVFAVFAPAMAVASAVEGRHRRRRDRRHAGRRRREARERFEQAACAAHTEEARRTRDRHLDIASVVAEVVGGGPLLWRECGPAPGPLAVGRGDVPWRPSLAPPVGAAPLDGVDGVLGDLGPLRDVPVTVDVATGPIGIVGPTETIRGVARWMVLQAAVRHDPGDLALEAHSPGWEWTQWLPHVASPARARLVVVDLTATSQPCALDGTSDAVIVIATHLGALPATTASVLTVLDDRGHATLGDATGTVDRVVVDAIASDVAADMAAAMARWRPRGGEPSLPTHVDAADLSSTQSPSFGELVVPLGHDGSRPVLLDLRRDGPHVLVTGTTGSGKSGLLRTFVAGLAARYPPTAVSFALLDFKGGSAFDDLAALPHVGTIVTDLDGDEIDRAFRSLGAEVRRREEILRAEGVRDLRGLPAGREPSLVVVMDELATLLESHAGAEARLVDLARRGRSLGIHLVLSTQKASGVVTGAVRANTQAHLTLRVLDPADSVDTVGGPVAATFDPDVPGRVAFARRSGPVRVFQCASVDPVPGRSGTRRVVLGTPPSLRPVHGPSARRLVAAPLPRVLSHADLPGEWTATDGDAVTIGIVDRPDCGRTEPLRWRWRDGGLLVAGRDGAARRRVLTAAVAAASSDHLTVAARIVALGANGPAWDELVRSPRVAARFATEPLEGPARALADVDPRDNGPGEATILLVDDLPGLVSDLEAARRHDLVASLRRAVTAGAASGVTVAAGADRPGAVPRLLTSGFTTTVVLALSGSHDHVALGLPAPGARRPPGRGHLLGDGSEVHLVEHLGIGDARQARGRVRPILLIPDSVDVASLGPATVGTHTEIPIGRRGGDGAVVSVRLGPGRHMVVAGARGTGRTTALMSVTAVLASAGARVVWIDGSGTVRVDTDEPTYVIVDDAGEVGDDTLLTRLVDAGEAVHLVVALRSDRREMRPRWLEDVLADRTGILLAPDAVGADLLGVRVPPAPSGAPTVPGRGWVVGAGHATEVQVAHGAGRPAWNAS